MTFPDDLTRAPGPGTKVGAAGPASKQTAMDERSTRVAQALQMPMLVAAALTLPAVAIGESHAGDTWGDIADVAIHRLDELRAQLNSLEVAVGRIVGERADARGRAD